MTSNDTKRSGPPSKIKMSISGGRKINGARRSICRHELLYICAYRFANPTPHVDSGRYCASRHGINQGEFNNFNGSFRCTPESVFNVLTLSIVDAAQNRQLVRYHKGHLWARNRIFNRNMNFHGIYGNWIDMSVDLFSTSTSRGWRLQASHFYLPIVINWSFL